MAPSELGTVAPAPLCPLERGASWRAWASDATFGGAGHLWNWGGAYRKNVVISEKQQDGKDLSALFFELKVSFTSHSCPLVPPLPNT